MDENIAPAIHGPTPAHRMKLLVVILNYRITDMAIDCLRSLSVEVPRSPDTKVAICENGTGGDAEQKLRQAIDSNRWQDWVELTAISPNRGFTGGNNVIIRKWMEVPNPPEYFLLLNADTLVQPGALQELVRFMDTHPKVGIAGSRLDDPDGTPNGTPFRFISIASEFEHGLRLGIVPRLLSHRSVSMPRPHQTCQVDWVSGASMIIRREVIEAIGPLDEGLYTYFDDVDFCLNAARAGWQSWYVPDSKILHIGGASTGITVKNIRRRPPYWFQARRRFFLKNYGALYAALADAAFLFGFALWRLRRMIQGLPDTDPPHMLMDSLSNSVFVTGFELREVENPALKGA